MPHNSTTIATHFAAKFFLELVGLCGCVATTQQWKCGPPPSLFGFGLWGGKLSVAVLALIAST